MLTTRGALVVALVTISACAEWAPSDMDGFTSEDISKLEEMVLHSRSAPPSDPGNEVQASDAARVLGQALFFDKGLARRTDGSGIACTECHSPIKWFSDAHDKNNVSFGLGSTRRNSPSLVNVALYRSVYSWDGRADSLWGQAHVAYSAAPVMAGTPDALRAVITARYATEFAAAFPDVDLATATTDAVYRSALKAWAAYLGQLISGDAPFDRYVEGDREALTLSQKNGLHLFLGKADCISCHRGPGFSDGSFHSVGVGQTGPSVVPVDDGRKDGLVALGKLAYRPPDAGTPAAQPEDLGRFRTKSLRQVAETGPYFHAGQVATLRDVVWFYNEGGDRAGSGTPDPWVVQLKLTTDEQSDLVAFLDALTGAPLDASLTCDRSHLVRRPVLISADGGSVYLPDGGFEVSADGRACTGADGGTVVYEPFKRDFTACADTTPEPAWSCP